MLLYYALLNVLFGFPFFYDTLNVYLLTKLMNVHFETSDELWEQNLTQTYLFHTNPLHNIISSTTVSCTCPLVTSLLEYWSSTRPTNQRFPVEKKMPGERTSKWGKGIIKNERGRERNGRQGNRRSNNNGGGRQRRIEQ